MNHLGRIVAWMGKISVDSGDRRRSIEINRKRQFVTAIFSFRTVKERRRLVEMVKQGVLCRFEGGTGQGVIIHGHMA